MFGSDDDSISSGGFAESQLQPLNVPPASMNIDNYEYAEDSDLEEDEEVSDENAGMSSYPLPKPHGSSLIS